VGSIRRSLEHYLHHHTEIRIDPPKAPPLP
jgi:hypothetical protein